MTTSRIYDNLLKKEYRRVIITTTVVTKKQTTDVLICKKIRSRYRDEYEHRVYIG